MTEENQIIVLKFGTTSVCDLNTLEVREDWIQTVGEDVKELISNGNKIVIFSSGGLATGKKRGKNALKGKSLLQNKNLLGALGLSELLYKWQKNFERIGLPSGSLVIREEDIKTTAICQLIIEMIENGITPIINENIPLQSNFNNDELAAQICKRLNASKFVLFTDTDGIFTANPKTNPNAQHLTEINIDRIDVSLDDENFGLGSGGMKTKLESAIKVKRTGIDTIIANGIDFYPIKNLQKKGKYTVLI